MSNFKIQGIGLDSSTLTYDPGVSRIDDGYNYLMTNISKSNDFVISSYAKNLPSDIVLLTVTDYLDNISAGLGYHLEELGRKYVDLLLVTTNANWDDYAGSLKLAYEENKVKHFGLEQPSDVEAIKKCQGIMDTLGLKIEYITLPICPLEFNNEIITYCNENKIGIIGLNPFGGYLSAPRNITAFSVPYLLMFAAYYCDIVMVSGRDMIKAYEDKEFLSSLIGREADPGMALKKSISKPVKEIKQAVYTSLKMDEDNIIPYTSPETLLYAEDYMFKFGLSSEKVKKTEDGGLTKEGNEFLSICYFPTDAKPGDIFALGYYRVMEFLRNRLGSEYELSALKVGQSVLFINAVKEDTVSGHLLWQKIIPGDTKQFYLIATHGGTKKEDLYFAEVVEETGKNSVEEE